MSPVLYICTYTNNSPVLMCVCIKTVTKQPQNLCIISVIYCFVCVPHFLMVYRVAYFPVEHLIDKYHLKEKGLGKTRSVQMC